MLIRSPRSSEVANNSHSGSAFAFDSIKELATPDIMCQPWCIQYTELEQTQSDDLMYGLIHLLPKFHGFVGEDPYKHLKEFYGNTQQFGVRESATSRIVNEVVAIGN
ncbi:hypothetical protein CR513_43342, partial [Mucuna pruriens]